MNLVQLLHQQTTRPFFKEDALPPLTEHATIPYKFSSLEEVIGIARTHDPSDQTEHLLRSIQTLAAEPNRHGYLVGFGNVDTYKNTERTSREFWVEPKEDLGFTFKYNGSPDEPLTTIAPSPQSLITHARSGFHDWLHLYSSEQGILLKGGNFILKRNGLNLSSFTSAIEAGFAEAGGSTAAASYAAAAQLPALYARDPSNFSDMPYFSFFEPLIHEGKRAVRMHIVTPGGEPPLQGERSHMIQRQPDVVPISVYRSTTPVMQYAA